MKKLILAAAIVCAAAITHGAAMSWSLSGITASPDVSSLAGSVAYFMDASTWDDFSATASDAIGAFCAENNTYYASVVAGRTGTVASGTTASDAYAAGSSVSGYLVVFDNADATKAGYYAYTAVDTKTVPSSGTLSFAKSFATDTSGWKEVETGAIPEPTSGLLLLLGAAGLALRRRRA